MTHSEMFVALEPLVAAWADAQMRGNVALSEGLEEQMGDLVQETELEWVSVALSTDSSARVVVVCRDLADGGRKNSFCY